jgi:hypothetical protein
LNSIFIGSRRTFHEFGAGFAGIVKPVGHIKFDLGWFVHLEPFMSRVVAGEGYKEVYPEIGPYQGDRFRKVPHWFKMENFTGELD